MFVSIIIPVLNEEGSIKNLLQQLQTHRQQGHEVIVVDGGSSDKTVSIAELLADKVISSDSGRAMQMNRGVKHAQYDVFWFLHADTQIYKNAVEKIQQALNEHDWGRFNIKQSGSHILFRIIETMMNVRSCVTGIATGDQGIFVKRKYFDLVNGYTNIPLMEDIKLSKKLKNISKPACIKEPLTTSSRRWEEKGILSTVFLMWKLRFLYWIGVSTDKLAVLYK
jgi:rSAM/selenodomain-associated transferase 2